MFKDIASVIKNPEGERIQNFKFSAYYETAKFRGDQIRLVRQIRVGDFETRKPTSHIAADDTQVFRLS